ARHFPPTSWETALFLVYDMSAVLCASLPPALSQPCRRFESRRVILDTHFRRLILVSRRNRNSFEGKAVSNRFTSRKEGGGRANLVQYDNTVENNGKNGEVEMPAHDYISSVANPFVKHIVKLRRSSSYRHSVGSVVVVGTTPLREISEFLQPKGAKSVVDHLLVQDGADIPVGLVETSRHIVRVSPSVMQKLAGVESIEANETIGIIKLPKSFCDMESTGIQSNFQTWCSLPHRLLVLDGIQDPGNLGTLLRTAVAFQWDGVFLLPGCCDPFNEKALRASQGACFQVPIATGLWSHLEILRDQYQMDMYAAQQFSNKISGEIITRKKISSEKGKTNIMHSSSQRDLEVTESRGCNGNNPALLSQELISALANKPVSLVLGSEGKGLSEQSKTSCNLVAIPMPGGSESLNVSVAGGIFLFLLRRQIQLAEVKAAIEDEDAKAILLNSLSSKYSNVVFTLSQIQSQSLGDMIATLLAEEKRTTEDAEGHSQQESAFYSRTRKYHRRSYKSEIECHYCKKRGHTAWDCRVRANDVLKGKVISNTANIAMVEDPLDAEEGTEIKDARDRKIIERLDLGVSVLEDPIIGEWNPAAELQAYRHNFYGSDNSLKNSPGPEKARLRQATKKAFDNFQDN
ncbi:hypothetical protein KI387_022754, partial [Taxus chinensis]